MVTNPFDQAPLWSPFAWVLVLAVAGILEGLGISGYHGAIPLTQFIEDLVPDWARAMILGWLCFHFLVQPLMNHVVKVAATK
jgi:hypothetical protein